MPRSSQRDVPSGISIKPRRQDGATAPATAADGTVLYRVRMWDPVLKTQIERVTPGLDAAEQLLDEFNAAKRRPGRIQAEHIRFADAAARYQVAYRYKRDGTPRPKSSLAKERTCLNVYLLPDLGNAWIGDLDLGRRDIREDLKTRAAERTVMIPDIAMPAVRRLADRGAPGRERSNGTGRLERARTKLSYGTRSPGF